MAKLNDTTWVLGEQPTKTQKDQAGCWADKSRQGKDGKVGKKHSSLHHFFHKGQKQ